MASEIVRLGRADDPRRWGRNASVTEREDAVRTHSVSDKQNQSSSLQCGHRGIRVRQKSGRLFVIFVLTT